MHTGGPRLEIPGRLSELLRQDRHLHAAVSKTLGDFEVWLGDNRLVFFPDYTDHGTTHIARVMRGTESLIADAAWPHLTPVDAGCLVLAVLLHDCAMHLSRDGFLALVDPARGWQPKGRLLDKFRERDESWPDLWAEFIREATRWDKRRLSAIFDRAAAIAPPVLTSTAPWTDDHYLLIGEFLRRHHGRLAHEIAVAGVPGPSDHRLRFTDMPADWIAGLAGFIARSHSIPLRAALACLEPNGRKVWRGAHVPFLMGLLRVADYLELDATRAPKELLRIRSLRSPISRFEWRKHHAVHDVRPHEDDPQAMFVDAEPPDVEAFLGLRDLLRDLQREIDDCWNVLGEVYGFDPRLRDLGLTTRRVYSTLDDVEAFAKRVKYVPVDAHFRASGGDVLKLLVGPLYGENPTYGIRELLQNAVDACRELDDWRRQHSGRAIDQRDQRADVVIFAQEHEDRSATVTIDDRGIGMTADTITKYFLTAGASFRYAESWIQRHVDRDGHARVMRSGRFGVGVLAAFLIGPEIVVETRFVASAEGFRFVCRLDSAHVELTRHDCPVGTRISIRIPAMADGTPLHQQLRFDEGSAARRWYGVSTPSVAFGVQYAVPAPHQPKPVGMPIWNDEGHQVPAPGEELWTLWERVEHPDYDVVHWTPHQESTLWCNGLRIAEPSFDSYLGHHFRDDEHQFRCGERDEIRLSYPAISVWDSAGRLPLSLRRTGLAEPFVFDDVLKRPVCRDIIASLLVRLANNRRSCLEQFIGAFSRYIRPLGSAAHDRTGVAHPMIAGALDRAWLALYRDSAILLQADVLGRARIDSFLFAPFRMSVSESTRKAMILAREFYEPAIVLQAGFHPDSDGGIWESEAGWKRLALAATWTNPLAPSGSAFFCASGSRSIQSREVLVEPPWPNEQDVRAGPYVYESDSADRGWLHAFALRAGGIQTAHLPCLAAWQLEPAPEAPPPIDVLAEQWLELIGPRGIPLDREQRQDELRQAYRALAREISRWREVTT
jgi:molecular chaperone HtpG